MSTNAVDRADYRDVQRLGERIGVELPCTLLQECLAKGYPAHRWDYALHELGHLVLEKARRIPPNNRWVPIRIDENAHSNKGWAEFHSKLPGGGLLETGNYLVLPSEWSVQSWCFEVAKHMGWITQDEADQLLDEAVGGPAIRMFWSSASIGSEERWSLLGQSADTAALESWTLRRQHDLQLQRMSLYGVDFAAGQLTPSRTARAQGPYVQIVDAVGAIHGRLPRTLVPEAAPLLWALWNWSDCFGGLPPGMHPFTEFRGEGWRDTASWWAETLNEALVRHSRAVQAQIHELIHQFALKEVA